MCKKSKGNLVRTIVTLSLMTAGLVFATGGISLAQPSLPDLIITSISYTPPTPSTNDVINFEIVVKNQGTASSSATSLLNLVIQEGGNVNLDVPALAPGASITVYHSRKITAFGRFYVTAIADIYNTVMESDETNNSRSINVYISKPKKPDMVVDILTHSPANPTTIEMITITAEVKNVGPDPATTSTLAIQVGSEITPMTFPVPLLGPAGSFIVERKVLLPAPDTYIVLATADYNDVIDESNEENNTLTDTIIVVEPMLPDLVVDILEHDPANPRTIDPITITAVVKNIGHIPAGPSTLEIKVGDEASPETFDIPTLDVDSTCTVQRVIVLPDPGIYEVLATADVLDEVVEWFETNNTNTDSIEVNYPDQPDLIVTLEHSPALVTTIRNITIKAVVKNAGYVDATSSTLVLSIDNGTSPSEVLIPMLAPGATFEVERMETFPIPGTYHATAIADFNDEVDEFFEDNNTAEDLIECYESGPDLVVTLEHAPADPTTFDLITITATVENAGEQIASASTLSIKVGDEDPVLYVIPALAPLESIPIERQINLTEPDVYVVTATADVNEEVAEMIEDNNTAEDILDVKLPIIPDLAVTKMTYEPVILLINQPTTITVELMNIGLDHIVTTSTLWIQIGDELVPTSYIIPPLDMGTSCTVERTAVFPDDGTYLVTATADVDDVILELDEDNNIDTLELPVFESLFQRIKEYLLGIVSATPAEKKVMDVNKDGYVDIADMLTLLL